MTNPPRNVAVLTKAAEANGWTVTPPTYAEGPYINVRGETTRKVESFVLRMTKGKDAIGTSWVDGKFEFAYERGCWKGYRWNELLKRVKGETE